MEGLYSIGSSEKVRDVEGELEKVLRDLKSEIEEGDFIGSSTPPKVASSLQIPEDVSHYRRERQLVIEDGLQIREAMPLLDISEVMQKEITSCTKNEYNSDSLPLLLHQFFNDQIEAMANLKYMHLVRWTRYCKNSKTAKALYTEFQSRVKLIISHYRDAVERAKRLAKARENYLNHIDSGPGLIKIEDLEIFTSWLVCQMHTVKKIHALLKIIQWLPYSHRSYVVPSNESKGLATRDSQPIRATTLRRFSSIGKAALLLKKSSVGFTDPNIPTPPTLNLPGQQEHQITFNLTSALGGGLSSDEVSLGLPLSNDNIDLQSPLLCFLLGCYGIEVNLSDAETKAIEMDVFNRVLRTFKRDFYRQEEERKFPVYDTVSDAMAAGIRNIGITVTLKKDCPWIPFIALRPELDGEQERAMVRLKEKSYVDEGLRVFTKFFHVQDGQKILSCLREHTKMVHEPQKVTPVSVTTNRNSNETSFVWNKIFNYSNRGSSTNAAKDILDFEAKLTRDDVGGIHDSSFDISNAVDVLGLEDDDERRHPLVSHSPALSYTVLRHLRIRDLQRTCLSLLNYFRSVERTLTIYDSHLQVDGEKLGPRRSVFYGADAKGLNSFHYLCPSFTAARIEDNDFIEFSEIENHYDFYVVDGGRVHVQDQKGFYVMYAAALDDFREMEQRLLLIGSHYILKDKEKRQQPGKPDQMFGLQNDDLNLTAFGHQGVDRFGVLLDLWTNEAAFLENKRQLIDCYFEAYQHVIIASERHSLAQVIVNIMHKQPRYDFKADYFVKVYRMECVCLRLHFNFIKSVLDKQIEEQREYVQRVSRSEKLAYGIPPRIVPIQNIAVNTNRPVLKYVYLMEFHPSLGLASKIWVAMKKVMKEFVHIHKPKSMTELISMERQLFEVAQSQFDTMPAIGSTFGAQLQRDLFTEVYVEDPVFVCQVGDSLSESSDSLDSRTSLREAQQKVIHVWGSLLQIITLRHRLIEAVHETEILTKVYKSRAKELSLDECHAHLRTVAFEITQTKVERDIQQLDLIHLLEDEGKLDRYQPNALSLAVQELEEKHIWTFSFRSREGLLQAIQTTVVERMMTSTMVQIAHKALLATAVIKVENCMRWDRPEGLRNAPSLNSVGDHVVEGASPADTPAPEKTSFSIYERQNEIFRRVKQGFVSLQFEKFFLRDKMINRFLKDSQKKGGGIKTLEEIVRAKRILIEDFTFALHRRTTQHALRAQIIGYYASLKQLMSKFPTTRDSHFMTGTIDNGDEESDDTLLPDPGALKRRPKRVISLDAQRLLNLWYIPHYTEVLSMFAKVPERQCIDSLRILLRLTSALHDICQYLCAHAMVGSSQARLGSQKVQFSGVTADWGGTEGIGAELREIQRQINKLGDPVDPVKAADYLEKKRQVLYLEFDLTVSRLVRNTFLSIGKESAFERITNCMHSALQDLSNLNNQSVYSTGFPLPEPLRVHKSETENLLPWRTFLHRSGFFSCMPWHYYNIGDNLQLCLAGLTDTERHVVNGEILGVSLLLEDVLSTGRPDLQSFDNKQEHRSHKGPKKDLSRRSSVSSVRSTSHSPGSRGMETRTSVLSDHPLEALDALIQFLLIWSRLEVLKLDWGCRKLATNFIRSTRQYKSFKKVYETDILQIVYTHITARRGQKGQESINYAVVSDFEQLPPPQGVSEYELKARQLTRLLETLEMTMIHEVMRRLSREHTLVVAERSRDDGSLPTDLWKKSNMKENFNMSSPTLVEDFFDKLMSDFIEDQDSISFPKSHLNKCLKHLSSSCMERERLIFDSYASFYENLVRQQHQGLYMKEQEIKQLKDEISLASHNTEVDADCMLADKSHDLILEITALRSKVVDMSVELREKETELTEKIKVQFTDLVIELFNNAFTMKNRFQQFQSSLYDNVLTELNDLRKDASNRMMKLRAKSGLTDDTDILSQRIIKAEELRAAQWESKHLAAMILKLKSIRHWNRTRTSTKSTLRLSSLKQQAEASQKNFLEMNFLHEEKELLMKQEMSALRKALAQVEKECQGLRKKLTREQKLKVQRSHAQIQEAISHRLLDKARSSNIDKLIAELDEKEERLRELTELNDHELLLTRRSQVDSKKALKAVMSKLAHERELKSEAFERVDELQKQVEEYEEQITEIARGKGATYHATCFPIVPCGRTSPQRRLTPQVSARQRRMISSAHDRVRPFTTSRTGPESLHLPKCNSPDDGQPIRPKTVSARIRSKLKETLLAELELTERKVVT